MHVKAGIEKKTKQTNQKDENSAIPKSPMTYLRMFSIIYNVINRIIEN